MGYTAAVNYTEQGTYIPLDSSIHKMEIGRKYNIPCKWETFRTQLLQHWTRLDANDVDEAGPDRVNLARLIHNRYGINLRMVENYLRNFERMLPLA